MLGETVHTQKKKDYLPLQQGIQQDTVHMSLPAVG